MFLKNIGLVLCLWLAGSFMVWAGFPWGEEASFSPSSFSVEFGGRFERFLQEKSPKYFLDLGGRSHSSFFDLNGNYTYSQREKHHYFRLPEAALKVQNSSGLWALGRKKQTWVKADSFWNRHLWEPVYNDDVLRVQSSGWVGLFRDVYYPQGKIRLFGSWLFLPHFGPSLREKKGRWVSQSPWIIVPETKKIAGMLPFYHLKNIRFKDFLKPSFAALVSYRGVYASYAFKPLNELQVKIPPFDPINVGEKLKGSFEKGYHVDIFVHPVVFRHHIASLGWDLAHTEHEGAGLTTDYLLNTSVTYHHPLLKNNMKRILPSPSLERKLYVSTKGEIHIKGTGEQTKAYVAYTQKVLLPSQNRGGQGIFSASLKELLGEDFDKGFDSEKPHFLAHELFSFSRAVAVGVHYHTGWGGDTLWHLNARLNYDWIKQYFLFSVESFVTFGRIKFLLSADALFGKGSFSFQKLKEDIKGYKNKSRLFWGMSYVF